MIHINKGENNPHEWITEEEFKERYPQLVPVESTEIGERLRKARMGKKITLRDFGQLTGLGALKISEIEHGRVREPEKADIDLIEKILGCKL